MPMPIMPFVPFSVITTIPPLLMQAVFFLSFLVAASVFDIHKRIIPNSICVLIALTGLITFSPVNLFGIIAALPLFIAALCKQGSIGGGDIKLTASAGFVMGFGNSVAGLVIGLSATLIYYAGQRIVARVKKRDRPIITAALPMAPFLSIGFILIYLLSI